MGEQKESVAYKRLKLVVYDYLNKIKKFEQHLTPRADVLGLTKEEAREYYENKKENEEFKHYTFNKVVGVLLSYKANFNKLSKHEKMLAYDVFFVASDIQSLFEGKFDLDEVAKWCNSKSFSADEYFYYIEGCYQELVNRCAKIFGIEPPAVQLWYNEKEFLHSSVQYDYQNKGIIVLLGDDIKKTNSVSLHLSLLEGVLSVMFNARTYSYIRDVYNGNKRNMSDFDAYIACLFATEVAMQLATESELDRTVIPTCFDENEKINKIFSSSKFGSPIVAFNRIMGFEMTKKAIADSRVIDRKGKLSLFNFDDATYKEMSSYFEKEQELIDLNFINSFYNKFLPLITMMSDFNLSLGFNSSYSDKNDEVINFVGVNSFGFAPLEKNGFPELLSFMGVKTKYSSLSDVVENMSEAISFGNYSFDEASKKFSFGDDDVVVSAPIENGLARYVVNSFETFSDGEPIEIPESFEKYDDGDFEFGEIDENWENLEFDDLDEDDLNDQDEDENE